MDQKLMEKQTKPMFAAETELAAAVVQVLRADDWDVWQEVQQETYGKCADIVAVRGPVLHVVECKLQFGLDVVYQAIEWKGYAHFVSIAIPYKPSMRGGHPLLQRICRSEGIGVITVYLDQDNQAKRQSHYEISPVLFRRPITKYLLASMTEEQRAYGAKAGGRDRWTPWGQSCINIERYVANNPGCTLKEAIDAIRHHYGSDQAARASMRKWIEAKRLPVRFDAEGKLYHVNYQPETGEPVL